MKQNVPSSEQYAAKARVLVVDDDPALASLVAMHVAQWGMRSVTAHDESEMWRALDTAPDVLLLDVFLGPSDGSRLVAEVHRTLPTLPIIMVTRSADLEVAVRSMRNGARDYILKPIDFAKLERAVMGALEWRALQVRLNDSASREQLDRPHAAPRDATPATASDAADPSQRRPVLETMVGECPAMQRLRTTIRRAAPTNVPILILGETGTGKELAARALHESSDRAEGPFIAVNAAAIPHELIESELFGHEKGAFTGASERKIGFCERADGGTLFLDEIGEMAPQVQSKLLRFLQDHEVQRVGAQQSKVVDVRVVAATNVDPQAQINAGRLREDLYYRLRGVQVVLPPLRQRGDDVGLLADTFLQRANATRKEPLRLTTAALAALGSALWPGNVRQLENVVREAAILATGNQIDAVDLPPEVMETEFGPAAPGAAAGIAHPAGRPQSAAALNEREIAERAHISEALAAGKSPEEVAEELGVSRATLYRRIKKYRLSR